MKKPKNRMRLTWSDLDVVGAHYIDGHTLAQVGHTVFEKPVSRQRVHQIIQKVRKFLGSH